MRIHLSMSFCKEVSQGFKKYNNPKIMLYYLWIILLTRRHAIQMSFIKTEITVTQNNRIRLESGYAYHFV